MDDDKLFVLKDQLYTACLDTLEGDDEKAYAKIFTQEDLLALDVIPDSDAKLLGDVVAALGDEYLMITLTTLYGAAWKLRSKRDADKYHGLSDEQAIIYSIIDNAGAEGIWQQDIRKKTSVRDHTLKKVLKELESGKKLVKSFTSVQQVSHRCYIKADIKPSEKATGGPWFADGVLDESFIETLLGVTYNMIKESGSYFSASGGGGGTRSASSSPVLPKKGIIMGSASDAAIAARGKKRSADTMEVDDDIPTVIPTTKSRKTSQHPVRVPMPAGFRSYLTLSEITAQIAAANVTKGAPLKDADMKQLINILLYENRVEEVKVGKRVGYRITRVIKSDPQTNIMMGDDGFWEPPSNGLTTTPCGRCPVFELCEEGGPVWAGGCEYFDRWLI
jgi:DNA-directed RNA polymerase III subunit RPC6